MRIPVTLYVHTWIDVQDADIDSAQFFVEENHCMTNELDEIAARVAKDHEYGVCTLCAYGGQVLGHVVPISAAADGATIESVIATAKHPGTWPNAEDK